MPDLIAPIVGRFAPSPSGSLHFGSLLAAVASYLQTKSRGGQWLLRIEDIDQPRTQPGAADAIMRDLAACGLHWDGPVWYQSERLERYQQVVEQLTELGLIYGCDCSRKQVAAMGGHYNGYCRTRQLVPSHKSALAYRLKSSEVQTEFHDLLLGQQQIPAAFCQEDYIIKRRDGLFAYQLVVVIDDRDQQVSEVIRGADLLEMTTRQQRLFQLLHAKVPAFGHIPLIAARPGFKLSKQNHAPAIHLQKPAILLQQALMVLGQAYPAELNGAPVREIVAWAVQHWDATAVPKISEIVLNPFN